MGETSCLFEIHSRFNSMSEKEKRIATFILAAPRDAVYPSIEELADKIGVSESTLFRFVRKLGYTGYQLFRIALATETVDAKARVYEQPVEAAEGESAVPLVFGTAIAALEMTMQHLDREALARAADIVVGSRRVLFLGLGGSGLVARDAYHKLLRCGICCSAPQDFHLQIMAASQGGKEDAAFLVSHTGVNKDALALADEVRRSGATLVVLSSYPRSPLARLADLLLVSATPTRSYASEAFSARIAQLAVVDSLYVEAMRRLGDSGLAGLDRMRAAIAKRRT
jgi:RpiR family carbohydrate utilization transcriptional regulator